MTAPGADLILYGVPFSQPVRAVMWLLLHQRHPFEMVLVNPGTTGENGSRHPAFLAKNPAGTIPTIEERASGFTLGEAHAILPYLCDRHGWDDLYPTATDARARIDQLLHWHHRNLRDASVGLVAPRIRKDLDIPEAVQQMAQATVRRALQTMEHGWLADQPWLAGEALSIADLAAYVEVGQLQPQFTNLFDFSPYPAVQAWLQRLQAVPGHEVVHTVLGELGDISGEPPSMDQIRAANKAALRALKAALGG